MRIGMVLDREFPPDDRVEKEALSLIAHGFEVHLLCFKHDRNQPSEEIYKHIHVHRVYLPRQAFKKLSPLILTFPVYAWYWRRQMERFVGDKHIDVLHIHDLPLVGTALKIREKRNVPVVADLHENYPVFIEISRHTNTLLGRLLVSKKKWYHKETEWLQKVDVMICVAEEMCARIFNNLTKRPRAVVVPNTMHPQNLLAMQEEVPAIGERFRDSFNVLFVGGFDTARGLDVLIDAATHLREEIPNLKIILVGRGSILNELKAQVRRLGLEAYVVFEGWQPLSKLGAYLAVSHVAVIPHKKSPQTDNSSPNKLFQFMLFKKPIVSSDCASIRRIIEQEQCGLIFESGNSRQLAERILTLYRSPEQRERLAANGYRAVMEKYQWDKTVVPLIQAYRQLADGA